MSRSTVEIVYCEILFRVSGERVLSDTTPREEWAIDSITVGGFEMYAHICHPTFEAIRQKLNSGLY